LPSEEEPVVAMAQRARDAIQAIGTTQLPGQRPAA
jgi:hypothetical protein